MRVSRIKRTTAVDEVFRALHALITSGELKPGDRLPSQRELARRLEVSRSTLREAIHKLIALGFLAPKQGVGTIVGNGDPLLFVRSLGEHFLIDGVSAAEFLEARVVVETAVVRLAVERATERQKEHLRNLLLLQREAAQEGDIHKFSRFDTEFHLALAEASGNRVLLKMEQTILDLLRQFIGKVSELPGAVEDALTFHTEILASLEEKDHETAEKTMACHLSNVAGRISSYLGVEFRLELVLSQKRGTNNNPKGGRN